MTGWCNYAAFPIFLATPIAANIPFFTFAAFASAKHGLRAVAQSMSRELGPLSIHVAHVVIDGAVDGVFIRSNRDDVDNLLADDAILKPEDIAQSFVALSRQPRSAWTHELDVRPWKESW